ncbi:MAG TPA: AmpG family muropeptide MFS transporter [Cyanobacteria bacterium UBA11369]|nr:AmpG family muropeptide MFS transporter [Cyanobacteria bacterium UBA11371]HBE32312.1 AmpG family muropeptide MFS transporter [Cyanobacteria bacterium UBA11368]HBE52931.1 AmpG family muropeptide MFS transporter [Cyanobacteria bacterium UBA11369]
MKAIQSWLKVFESRKMAALLLLGFSSGLPFLLTRSNLQAWMTKENIDITAIGLINLVALPYSLKFVWSPLLDRFVPPFLGRRRGWLILSQIVLAIAIAAMAIQKPAQALQLVVINAVLIAFFGATQDIAADAYRTDVLEKLEMGAGAAVFVLGFRIALLVTGSVAFILADQMPWPIVYLLMALLMVIGIAATIFAPEPVLDHNRPESLEEAVIFPFAEFFQRNGLLLGVLILLFAILYNLADALLSSLSTPFLLNTGFSQTDIGAIRGGMGLFATIFGTLAGGSIVSKLGINRSLWIFAALQALSNLSYFAIAVAGKNYPLLVLGINVENFCGGIASAGFVAYLMSLCNQRYSATQYALLTSFMAFSRDVLVSPSGFLQKATGWPVFFLITIAAAVPAFILLPVVAPWKAETAPMPRPGLDDPIDE